ncbi:MAG: metalloregulator ArsR/SmtB family transcription factor [Desulfocapsaceae bacterium]|nr:metalloregulator ArsR/SmtB family transcription factor [Desulfocapsaceae bacterium]
MNDDKCGCRIIHFQAVADARSASLNRTDYERLAQMFKIMADPSRLRILWALERQEMCVCDIAAFLEISESAVSHQLRLLRGARLVKNRREGTVLYYRLVDDHVKMLTDIALNHIKESND